MTKYTTISAQVTDDVKEWIREDADDRGITLSEWLNDVILEYIDDGSEDLTFEDLDEMDFDELVAVVEDYELDIDPEDYTGGLLVSAREKLRDAVCYELEIEEE